MTSVDIHELGLHLEEHMKAVEAGETIEVTSHDRVIARIVPSEPPLNDEQRRRLRELGVIKATRPFSDFQNKPYTPVVREWNSLDLLLEERGDR